MVTSLDLFISSKWSTTSRYIFLPPTKEGLFPDGRSCPLARDFWERPKTELKNEGSCYGVFLNGQKEPKSKDPVLLAFI